MIRAATSFILLLLTAPVGTETVDVRDSGPVDLATFECRDINRSTVIQRVCYNSAQHAMIVAIKGSYDRFCELAPETFDGFMTAPSMGQFFNQNIRDNASGGRYDCRAKQSPNG
jgi:KTSC domain